MTIASFCKANNIKTSEVLGFLQHIGIKASGINMKLTEGLALTLQQRFCERRVAHQTGKIMPAKNSTIKGEAIDIFSKNLFTSVQDVINYPGLPALSSYFNDNQVKRLCERMGNPTIRAYAKKWLTAALPNDYDLVRYQLHSIANRALKIYGGKILSYLYELPIWAGKNSEADILKMNPAALQKVNPHYPTITFKSIDGTKSYSIRFTKLYERGATNYLAARFVNNRTRVSWPISTAGLAMENFQTLIPELVIFREITKNGFSLSCGYDDGYCDICGRRLEDPVSIKYGRGPACRSNYGNT